MDGGEYKEYIQLNIIVMFKRDCSHCRNIYSNPFLQSKVLDGWSDLAAKRTALRGFGDHLSSDVKVQNGTGEKS